MISGRFDMSERDTNEGIVGLLQARRSLAPPFFFKQKTAYEIGVRLVGSEMCIRDSTFSILKLSILLQTISRWCIATAGFLVGLVKSNSSAC